jgi:NCS1 family nucleobase:cation symporter-1
MPVGAVVFAEHWLFPRLGIEQYSAEKRGWSLNGPALAVWVGTLAVCFLMPIHLYFRWLPGYLLALVFYVLLSLRRKNCDE